MLAMLPMRGVMALEQTACETHDEGSQLMQDHSMHRMHGMADDAQAEPGAQEDCCCCDTATSCMNDCGAGFSISFITQPAVALPDANKPVYRSLVNLDLVFADPAPPVRPPAHLQI